MLENMARREAPLMPDELVLDVKCDVDLPGPSSVRLIHGCLRAESGLILQPTLRQPQPSFRLAHLPLTFARDPSEDTLSKSRERGRRCNSVLS